MRKYFFYFALFLLGCSGNGDGGSGGTGFGPSPVAHVPEISSFSLSPVTATLMQGDGTLLVTAEIGFRDAGLDIQTLWIRMPNGTNMQMSESFSTETGTFTETIVMPTNQAGVFPVEIWLVDEAGDNSVHRTAEFSVIGEDPNSAGGIWNGAVSNDLTGQSFEMNGVITQDNFEGRFLIDGTTLFVLRDIYAAGGQVTATISVSIRPDTEVVALNWENSGVLTGTLVERTRIEAEWFLDSGDFGTMTLDYDDLYERGSDISRLAGIWKSSWDTIFNIDALGEFFGQRESGCVYSGKIERIDADYNVYKVDFFDGCLVYQAVGLGVLGDQIDTDDAFDLLLGEGWFLADTWQRQ